jgi:8-oxo-dGTP pyrophosphatase MutT (NUDIX family)
MREEGVRRIEVHVAGICFDRDRVLVLKRSLSRRLFPGLWECGGGQVNPGEGFGEAVARQLREEAGVITEMLGPAGIYDIFLPEGEQKKIPGIHFACIFKGYAEGSEPRLSAEHTEWKWQPLDRLDELEFIPGLKEDIRKAHSLKTKQ